MDKLNPDCLRLIFTNLDVHDLVSVSMVCKEWKTVAYRKQLWKPLCIKLTCGSKAFSSTMLRSLKKRGVTNVMIREADRTAGAFKLKQLQRVIQHLYSTLHTLDIADFELGTRQIQAVFNKEMSNLKSLKLPCLSSPTSILHVSQVCPKLHTLVSVNAYIHDQMIETLVCNMPDLKELVAAPTAFSTDDTMRDL